MYRYTMGDNCMSAWLVVQQILVKDTWSQLQKYAKSKNHGIYCTKWLSIM